LARRHGWFDSFVNGMNRLPRPLITYTVFGLFLMVLIDPPVQPTHTLAAILFTDLNSFVYRLLGADFSKFVRIYANITH
jgi:hypothetical protein